MIEIKAHVFVFFWGLNLVGFDFVAIRTVRIKMDRARATTPPSFEGIERKIT
jgi:peroxiredoxin family protein